MPDPAAVRRYIAVIQDPRGYPPRGELDKAPPDGPEPPMMLAVVKADEHEAEVARLRRAEPVLDEVATERARQDVKWGGHDHDVAHSLDDWHRFIGDHLARARQAAGVHPSREGDTWRQQMIRVAALAAAAVESYDARQGHKRLAREALEAGER